MVSALLCPVAVRQSLVDHVDGHGAFTNRRGHPLDESISYVANGEYSGETRLDKERANMGCRPSPGIRCVAPDARASGITTGEEEAVVIGC